MFFTAKAHLNVEAKRQVVGTWPRLIEAQMWLKQCAEEERRGRNVARARTAPQKSVEGTRWGSGYRQEGGRPERSVSAAGLGLAYARRNAIASHTHGFSVAAWRRIKSKASFGYWIAK
jgi:hypothetical protein